MTNDNVFALKNLGVVNESRDALAAVLRKGRVVAGREQQPPEVGMDGQARPLGATQPGQEDLDAITDRQSNRVGVRDRPTAHGQDSLLCITLKDSVARIQPREERRMAIARFARIGNSRRGCDWRSVEDRIETRNQPPSRKHHLITPSYTTVT